MSYEIQLLPTTEQVDVLLTALRDFCDPANYTEQQIEIAEELRLEILKKRRLNHSATYGKR